MIKLKFNCLLITIGLVFLFKNLKAQYEIDCPTIKSRWDSHKYQYTDELSKLTLSNTVNTICPKSTCCDNSMKTEIIGVSQLKLKSVAQLHMKSIIEFLYNNSKDLNDYFQNNLDLSKNQLNQIFISTYSSNYKTNQPFFFEFYEKLKQYMVGNEQNIEKILETFFHDMAERILTMMVLAKKDPETIRCLTNNFLKSNPYQNIDKKIIGNFKSSYPVARMLVNSLKAAHDVFLDLSEKLVPSSECTTEYAKAFYCSWCSATEIMPCEGLCKSVIGKCFGSLNSKEMNRLNKAWKALLAVLDKISKKLKHPFNYSEINKNLHLKLSDAIMNVHNFFPTVREKISENCKTQLTWEQRSEDVNDNQDFESLPKSSENNIQPKAIELSEIIDKFSAKMQDMTQHLQKYKNIICSSKLKLPKPGNQCWNGIETTSVFKPKSKEKSLNKNLSISPLMKASITKLSKITVTLKDLLTTKNSDPHTFKIKFVEKPKRTEIPRPRPSRISEQITEGSGGGVGNIENTNIKNKPDLPSIDNNKPIVTIEGSGNKKSSGNQNTKDRPAFPKFPINNVNTPKPENLVKQTTISDDEDFFPKQNINEKEKIQKPFDGKKPQIEGSGSFEKSSETPKIITTVATTIKPIPINEPKISPKNEDSSLPEGSGQEKPSFERSDDFNSKISFVSETTTIIPVEDVTTQPVFLPNDLPGEIPSEIWIPRVVDYDSRGQLINNPHLTASNIKLYITALYSAVFFSVTVVHNLI